MPEFIELEEIRRIIIQKFKNSDFVKLYFLV